MTITIGNHTNKTGIAANAMQYKDMALKDVVEYYNENNLIPGVEVKVVEYDNQADPFHPQLIPALEKFLQMTADGVL